MSRRQISSEAYWSLIHVFATGENRVSELKYPVLSFSLGEVMASFEEAIDAIIVRQSSLETALVVDLDGRLLARADYNPEDSLVHIWR